MTNSSAFNHIIKAGKLSHVTVYIRVFIFSCGSQFPFWETFKLESIPCFGLFPLRMIYAVILSKSISIIIVYPLYGPSELILSYQHASTSSGYYTLRIFFCKNFLCYMDSAKYRLLGVEPYRHPAAMSCIWYIFAEPLSHGSITKPESPWEPYTKHCLYQFLLVIAHTVMSQSCSIVMSRSNTLYMVMSWSYRLLLLRTDRRTLVNVEILRQTVHLVD